MKDKRQASLVPRWLYVLAALGIVGLAVAVVVATRGGSDAPQAAGTLPEASDYHSLIVAREDANDIRLGTHQGIFRSRDGGRTWRLDALSGSDAMSLDRGRELWAAGHGLLAKSADDGRTWDPLSPPTLPSLDIHGFAVDEERDTVYAAVAGQGLFASNSGGASFAKVSDVGAGVMALAVTGSGTILAGDMQEGLLSSTDHGRTWARVLRAPLMGIATNPEQRELVIASGPGVFRSTDGGRRWKRVFDPGQRLGPLAWAPSEPDTGYLVGYDDRTLFVTHDSGLTWAAAGS